MIGEGVAYVLLHSAATGMQLVKIQHFKSISKSFPSVFIDANVSGD